MQQRPPFLILSAEKASLPADMNAQRTAFLERQLQDANLAPIRVNGLYEGTRETSFLIFEDSAGRAEEAATRLARAYGQDTLLRVDGARRAYLEDLRTGSTIDLGYWSQIDSADKARLNAYTETADGSVYATLPAPHVVPAERQAQTEAPL